MDQAARLRALVNGGGSASVLLRDDAPESRERSEARVIAVTSGKGGVGKTTIAVNLALMLAQDGNRTLIVDADLGLANVDVMLGLDSGRHMGHLLLTDYAPEDVAQEGPVGLKVLSGGSGLRELAEAEQTQRLALLNKLRKYYRSFDIVVVDTSPGISSETLDFLEDADDIVLVTTTEPTSIRDTYAATKAIAIEQPASSPMLVVNNASADAAAKAVGALNAVTERFLDRVYDERFHIEPDPLVGRSISERRPMALAYPRSPAACALRRLARLLEPCGQTEL